MQEQSSAKGLKTVYDTIAFPEKAENGGVGDATIAASIPSLTSWKTITVGETLKPIVETTSCLRQCTPTLRTDTGLSTRSLYLELDTLARCQL